MSNDYYRIFELMNFGIDCMCHKQWPCNRNSMKFLVADFSATIDLHSPIVNLLLVPKPSLKLALWALHSLRACPLVSYQWRRYFPPEAVSPYCLPVACIMPPRKAGRKRRSILQICRYRQRTCNVKKQWWISSQRRCLDSCVQLGDKWRH